jgi:hypothetical protein
MGYYKKDSEYITRKISIITLLKDKNIDKSLTNKKDKTAFDIAQDKQKDIRIINAIGPPEPELVNESE